MTLYHVICAATLPNATPYVEVTESFKTLREAEECFARIIDSYENDAMYGCDLNDDTFVAHSRFSDIKYYFEIHTSEVN